MAPKKSAKQLATKLARIMAEIETVAKTGYNDFHKYSYATEANILEAVRAKLSAASIFIYTSTDKTEIITTVTRERRTMKDGTVVESEKASHITAVTTLHTIVDGESGEQFVVQGYGQGQDSGDKGGYKALTGAIKYFLLKTFMIPTGDDPEATDGNGAKTEQPRHESQSQPAAPRVQVSAAPAKTVQAPKLPDGVRVAFNAKDPKPSAEAFSFAKDTWHTLMTQRGVERGEKRDAVLAATLKRCYQVETMEDLRKRQCSDFIDANIAAFNEARKVSASSGSLREPAAPGSTKEAPTPQDSQPAPAALPGAIAEGAGLVTK